MLNQVVLVGRLTHDPEMISLESGKNKTVINVAVSRPYKNSDGIYESDFIRCTLWNGIASNTTLYCHKGDIIGIKGRLQTSSYEDSENVKKYLTEVIAERVSFIGANKKETSNE